jgi:hypothetical protein
MNKKYVLKGKGRFTVTIIVVLTIILSAFFANTVYGYKKPSFKVITVKSGDTLWDIAKKYSDNKDIRKYIYDIKEVNNLNSSFIYEGSRIRVPVE